MIADGIRPTDFLERLGVDTRGELEATAQLAQFGPGDQVFGSGNLSWVGVVQRGLVRILSYDSDGRPITHRNVSSGGVVGLSVLVGSGDDLVARSVGRTVVLKLDPRVIGRLRDRDARFSVAVARELHDRLVETDHDARLRIRGALPRRLALELVDMAAELCDGDSLTLAVTHEALADALGSSREAVSRQLAVMSAKGVLRQRGKGRLELLDLEKLTSCRQSDVLGGPHA